MERNGRSDGVGLRINLVQLIFFIARDPYRTIVGDDAPAARRQENVGFHRSALGIEARERTVTHFGNHPDRAFPGSDAPFTAVEFSRNLFDYRVRIWIDLIDQLAAAVGNPDRVFAYPDVPILTPSAIEVNI